MEQPPSHDLSEYQPINLKSINLGSYEEKLQREGWTCVRVYGGHENEIKRGKDDVAKIQEAGAEAQITYYDAEREGRLWDNDDAETCGPRVWMRLPEMSFGTPV